MPFKKNCRQYSAHTAQFSISIHLWASVCVFEWMYESEWDDPSSCSGFMCVGLSESAENEFDLHVCSLTTACPAWLSYVQLMYTQPTADSLFISPESLHIRPLTLSALFILRDDQKRRQAIFQSSGGDWRWNQNINLRLRCVPISQPANKNIPTRLTATFANPGPAFSFLS